MPTVIDTTFSRPTQRLDPAVAPGVYLAPGIVLMGDVRLAEHVNVWPGSVLRGDLQPVIVGAYTNIQEHTICHVANGAACLIGDHCTIGHRAVIHGCTIEPGCLIGIGAIVLTGARVGEGSIVAAGALVLENAVIPPRSLIVGLPSKVVRTLKDDEAAQGRELAIKYAQLADAYRAGHYGVVAPTFTLPS